MSSITSAIAVSLQVASLSTALALVPGVAAGIVLGVERFRCREPLVSILYTALAFPTVVIGLTIYMFISRSGPLGPMGMLYTRTAIVIGQWILVAPIIATFTLSAVKKLDPAIILTARSLGARRPMLYATILKESRYGIFAGLLAAFGRAVSEVGVSMILGGNIAGVTRTMTTLIALEHDKGQFSAAIILGAILLAISLSINVIFHAFQNRVQD